MGVPTAIWAFRPRGGLVGEEFGKCLPGATEKVLWGLFCGDGPPELLQGLRPVQSTIKKDQLRAVGSAPATDWSSIGGTMMGIEASFLSLERSKIFRHQLVIANSTLSPPLHPSRCAAKVRRLHV